MTTQVRTQTVGADDADQRLDRWLRRQYADMNHVQAQKLIRTGQVRVDGKRAKAAQRLTEGQEVRLPPFTPKGDRAATRPPKAKPEISERDAEDLRARVLHRDHHVLVIDKPAGLAVQGGTKTAHHLDGMLDALQFDAAERPRLVHRLDRDTSGVLVLARTQKAAAFLTSAFREGETRKIYWALVAGVPPLDRGLIDLPLAKQGGRGGEKMAGDDTGKPAQTLYQMIDHAGRRAAWLQMEPLTGRTHQLRAHAAAMGTPIVGDGKYGGADARLEAEEVESRLHLHARAIRMPHPAGGTFEAEAPLPPHMARAWAFFGFSERDVFDPFETGDNGG